MSDRLNREQVAAYRAALRRSSGAVAVGDDHLAALLDAYEAQRPRPASRPLAPVSVAALVPPVTVLLRAHSPAVLSPLIGAVLVGDAEVWLADDSPALERDDG